MSTYIPFAVAALLMITSIIDMRTGRIPNWVSFVFIGLFAVLVALSPDKMGYVWQVVFAAVVFGVGLALYAFVGLGAGAVKLLAAAALFLPMSRTVAITLILIASTFVLGLTVTFIRNKFGSETSSWKVMRERIMPLSLPVTATTLLAMFWLQA